MKNSITKGVLMAATLFGGMSLLAAVTHATVGGPTLIHTLQYGTEKNYVLYEEQNYGGKGCPPGANLLDLRDGSVVPMVSCSDADWMDTNAYNQRLESTLSRYPNLLKHIDLTKNGITANVSVTKVTKSNEDAGIFPKTDFKMDVYQNGTLAGSFSYSGCSANQVHIVEGYVIPYTTNLVLLLSTKGDCFEGGYTNETLHVIHNVNIVDMNFLPLKGNTEAAATIGNLSIVASNPASSGKIATPKPSSNINIPASPQTTETAPISRLTSGNMGYIAIIIALIIVILVLILRR